MPIRVLLIVVGLAGLGSPALAEPGRQGSILTRLRGIWSGPRMDPVSRSTSLCSGGERPRPGRFAALRSSPPVQILRGIARAPIDTLRVVRQHPLKTLAAVVTMAAASALLEVLSLPAQPIMLGACGLLTLRALKQGFPLVREAFRRRAPDRYEQLGSNLAYPVVAYAGATALTLGVGGALERLSASPALAGGGKGIAYGLHLLDDLPAIASSLGGARGAAPAVGRAARIRASRDRVASAAAGGL